MWKTPAFQLLSEWKCRGKRLYIAVNNELCEPPSVVKAFAGGRPAAAWGGGGSMNVKNNKKWTENFSILIKKSLANQEGF